MHKDAYESGKRAGKTSLNLFLMEMQNLPSDAIAPACFLSSHAWRVDRTQEKGKQRAGGETLSPHEADLADLTDLQLLPLLLLSLSRLADPHCGFVDHN